MVVTTAEKEHGRPIVGLDYREAEHLTATSRRAIWGPICPEPGAINNAALMLSGKNGAKLAFDS
jgi:hypothetical protein